MFMTKAAHAAIIAAKDAHIAQLQDEARWLRRMVQPERATSAAQVEADLIIEGRQDQVTDAQRQAVIDTEAALLLSGNYN